MWIVESARQRMLAALLPSLMVVGVVGCEERERWPEAAERARPLPIAPPVEGECITGTFCVPAPSAVVVAAPPPHERCELGATLPDDVASELAAKDRQQVRIRFDDAATASGAGCCYRWMEHCRGRALLVGEAPRVARPRTNETWLLPTQTFSLPPQRGGPGRGERSDPLDPLAQAWLRDAAHEHASIAAFARAALSLIHLGAPPSLLIDCHHAAKDEIRHARLAYTVASHLAGRPFGPAPLPLAGVRALDADALALDTFVGGCIGETIAAVVMAEAARRAPEPLAGLLGAVAADEERHAILSWHMFTWLAPRIRASTRDAIAQTARDFSLVVDDGPANEAWGLLPRSARRALGEAALQRIVVPLTAATLSSTASCAAQPSMVG